MIPQKESSDAGDSEASSEEKRAGSGELEGERLKNIDGETGGVSGISSASSSGTTAGVERQESTMQVSIHY